jgi:DNA-directed RNA polymerase subunit beta'
MLKMSLGQLLINEALPENMRDPNRVLDKKGIEKLFQELAERHPDKYREVAKKLSDVGRDVAYATGGFSTSLEDMRSSKAGDRIKDQIRREVQMIQVSQLPAEQKEQAIVAVVGKYQKSMEDAVFEEAKAAGNPFASQVVSGARGNRMNLKSLMGSDLLYVDHHDKPIPVPVLNSYPRGLSPVEYWAGAFGARKGVAATKFATQDAGFLAKQLNQINHRLIVTARDDPNDDGSGVRGLPAAIDDPDNEGALLARDTGPYKRNTVLTPKILKDLQTQGLGHILVRSPMVGGPPQGGVYARDVGVRERGGLAPMGDYVGLAAAQALSEKLSQGQLSAKHTGGVAGADKAVSGFAHINQLIQVPKTFKSGATHAQLDGKVSAVVDAPQGGKYVTIGSEQHYVPQGLDPSVKVGDTVEAGDAISDGIPNPAEVVQHKGVGEGRRYFVKAFTDAYRGSGMSSHRRNVELLARGLIDHVRVTDEFGDHVEDDVVPYSSIEKSWRPREGSQVVGLSAAVGKYLERPVLHHTIGTKIRPGMLPELEEFGVNNLEVHDKPPPFEPMMVRGMYNLQSDPDWMTRHLGSGLEKATLQAAHRGASSDIAGTSYVPALADTTSFGRQGLTRGWDPKEPRDADSDNLIYEGTPRERPKTPAGGRAATWRSGG